MLKTFSCFLARSSHEASVLCNLLVVLVASRKSLCIKSLHGAAAAERKLLTISDLRKLTDCVTSLHDSKHDPANLLHNSIVTDSGIKVPYPLARIGQLFQELLTTSLNAF